MSEQENPILGSARARAGQLAPAIWPIMVSLRIELYWIQRRVIIDTLSKHTCCCCWRSWDGGGQRRVLTRLLDHTSNQVRYHNYSFTTLLHPIFHTIPTSDDLDRRSPVRECMTACSTSAQDFHHAKFVASIHSTGVDESSAADTLVLCHDVSRRTLRVERRRRVGTAIARACYCSA